jgi:hypothetical protein
LGPLYWLYTVLRIAATNHVFPSTTMRTSVGVNLEAAFSSRSSRKPYMAVQVTAECQGESPWRWSTQPSNEVHEDRETDHPNKLNFYGLRIIWLLLNGFIFYVHSVSRYMYSFLKGNEFRKLTRNSLEFIEMHSALPSSQHAENRPLPNTNSSSRKLPLPHPTCPFNIILISTYTFHKQPPCFSLSCRHYVCICLFSQWSKISR